MRLAFRHFQTTSLFISKNLVHARAANRTFAFLGFPAILHGHNLRILHFPFLFAFHAISCHDYFAPFLLFPLLPLRLYFISLIEPFYLNLDLGF
jgi:hypothetical protein